MPRSWPLATTQWTLDETEGNATHESVNGSNDVVVDSPLWQPTGGKVDGALELDGMDDCVISGSGPNPADGPFSVFAWIKGGTPGQVIISQPTGGNWLAVDAEGNLITELRYIGGRATEPPLVSHMLITDDAWHRVALSWDGANRILYVDDVEVAKDTQPGFVNSEGGLYIGTGKDMAHYCLFSPSKSYRKNQFSSTDSYVPSPSSKFPGSVPPTNHTAMGLARTTPK